MADHAEASERALDQPGSADESTIRGGLTFALLILIFALGVVLFGDTPLRPFPQFSTFYATFILVVDGITCYLLLGQFTYRRRLIYAVLATAYLFKSLIMLPFLFCFPGALMGNGQVLGGAQSSAWIWNAWHFVFPVLIGLAVLIQRHCGDRLVASRRIRAISAGSVATAILLVLLIAFGVTELHDYLPTLIGEPENTRLHTRLYVLSGATLCITALAIWLCWSDGRRHKTTLHLWLAITLFAFLADILASLSTTARFTVGWYFGRLEAMIAASLLLILFLGELNDLYRRLASMMETLLLSNSRLAALLQDKEALVTNLQHSEAQIRQLAYYDPLTGLPNRRLLVDRLGQVLGQVKRHHGSLAVMFMDLDHFKEVNDTLGHDVGDQLLMQVAGRMSACLRRGDTAARSGGDEFIIVLSEISHPEDAAQVADKIIGVLHAPFDLGGHTVRISISIGIAVYPVDSSDDIGDLLRKADQAMYAAKADGRDRYRFYSAAMERAVNGRPEASARPSPE